MKNKTGKQPCPYNIGLKCNIGDCECAKCGWYPMESYRRRRDLQQKGCVMHGQQVEKQTKRKR